MTIIRNLTVGGLVAGLSFIGTNRLEAGEQEWATAGKVLTGFAIAGAIHQATHHGGHVSVVIGAPHSPPIVAPRPVVFRPPVPVITVLPLRPRAIIVERRVWGPRPVVMPRMDHCNCFKKKHRKAHHPRCELSKGYRGYRARR